VQTDEKRILAEKIVDLTVISHIQNISTIRTDMAKEMFEKVVSDMREQQIQLHLKHFETNQLAALLDFYSSEMGASILASQRRVSGELAENTKIKSGTVKRDGPGNMEFDTE
jgi:hypothetical protein